MSSKKRPPVGGYEYDLRKAEDAMIEAGHPEVADEMRQHTQAIRNYMQGAIVPMFVEMVERALGPKIDGLRTDVRAWAQESAARLGKTEQDIETIFSTQTEHTVRLDVLDNIEEWRSGVDERLAKIEQADRDDIRAEIKDIKAALLNYEAKHQELAARLEERRAAAVGRDGDAG